MQIHEVTALGLITASYLVYVTLTALTRALVSDKLRVRCRTPHILPRVKGSQQHPLPAQRYQPHLVRCETTSYPARGNSMFHLYSDSEPPCASAAIFLIY